MAHRMDGPTGRMFRLVRTEDVSDIAGTGHIASGVVWPDGSVTLKWHTNGASIATIAHYPSLANMQNIHGHYDEGRETYLTQVKWVKDEQPASKALIKQLSDFTWYMGDYAEQVEKGLQPAAEKIRREFGKLLDLAARAAA